MNGQGGFGRLHSEHYVGNDWNMQGWLNGGICGFWHILWYLFWSALDRPQPVVLTRFNSAEVL